MLPTIVTIITQLSTNPMITASSGVYGESGPGNQKAEDDEEEGEEVEVALVVVNTGSERFVADDENPVEFV